MREREWGLVVGGAVISFSNVIVGCGGMGGGGGERNFWVDRGTEVFRLLF